MSGCRTNNLLRLVLFAAMAFAAEVRVHAAGVSDSEDLLKARYVHNFARLVDWPAPLAPGGQPIVIGVLGDDRFAAVLNDVVARKSLDDRTYTVKPVTIGNLRQCGCRILFVASPRRDGTAEIIALQNSESVLTIAETSDFARRGGVVGLTVRDQKVRLFVNVDAATRASLTISSRLLALATIVRTVR